MTMTLPVQQFQIGQRVRCLGDEDHAFVIRAIYFTIADRVLYSAGVGFSAYRADCLTLASERPPYVASERRVVRNDVKIVGPEALLSTFLRCETDTELAARHAVERAEYDRPCPADTIVYNAKGEPVGINGRTGQPGPGAA